MKTMILWATCGLLLTGCNANQGQSGTAPVPVVSAKATVQRVKSADGRVDGEIEGNPASGSRFGRLQIGMAQRQVEDLIGAPTDTDSHITGKQFIPFYFGGDAYRIVTFYKNQGRLEFAPTHFAGQANTLVRIVNNPAETGYAH